MVNVCIPVCEPTEEAQSANQTILQPGIPNISDYFTPYDTRCRRAESSKWRSKINKVGIKFVREMLEFQA